MEAHWIEVFSDIFWAIKHCLAPLGFLITGMLFFLAIDDEDSETYVGCCVLALLSCGAYLWVLQ